MNRTRITLAVLLLPILLASSQAQLQTTEQRLRESRKGVWLLPDGSFTIYTDAHYFVIVGSGDSTSPNIYCGASQVRYNAKGMARKQVVRMRQAPGAPLDFFANNVFQADKTEAPITIDPALFSPGVCNVKAGIIYSEADSVVPAGLDEGAHDYVCTSHAPTFS